MATLRFLRSSRWSFALLIVPFLAVALIATSHRTDASTPNGFPIIKQISQDIFRNKDSQHRTEVEPASFAFGNTIVAAFQDGRFFSSGGASDISFSTSTDGGKRWHYGQLPGITKLRGNGAYDRGSDPAVAYDAKHGLWMIETLPILVAGGNRPAEVLSRSTDGLTWQNPVPVGPSLGDSDKTWIACDNWTASPFYGNCYAEWDSTQTGLVNMSVSSDGGTTWGPALNTHDSAPGQGGLPQIQPNGTVIVPFYAFSIGAMASFESTNGGATWSNTTVIAPIATHLPSGGLRALVLPGAGMDGNGKVFIVWMDCSFRNNCASNDIVMSSSADGKTWSAPVPIPIDPTNSTVDHFIPGFGIDTSTKGAKGHLALTYYYYPNTNCFAGRCELNVGFIDSHDGGATWSAPIQLDGPMKLKWLPGTTLGPMVGDYVTTSFANGRAFGIFASADAPFVQTFDEAIFTIKGGVSQMSGTRRTPFGMRKVNFRSDHPMNFRPVPTD